MKKNNRKTVAALALAGALLTTPFAAQAATYKDVSANHWAYSHISKLSDLRIIHGYEDGTYRPTRSVSYLEVLTLLRCIQNPTPTEITQAISNNGHISDAYNVPKWAKASVCVALQNNVISEANLKEAYNRNYINNVKNANQFPSRELVLVYYAKALGIQPIKDTSNIKVSDIGLIGNTPKALTGDVDIKGLYAAMIEAGIFHSFGSDGKFNPASPLQRDQMATITNLSYDYVAQHKATQSFEGNVEVNVVVNNIPTFTIKDKDGKKISFSLAKDTAVTLNGKRATTDAITPGSTVKVQAFPQSGGVAPYQATSVTVIGNDTKATGIVDSIKNDDVKISYTTKKDSIVDDNFKAEKTESFKFDKDTVITSLGKKIDKNGVNLKDLVTFEANNGVLKEVTVYPYNGTVNGEFVNFEYYRFGNSRLILKLDDKKEHEFYVKDADVAENLYNLTKDMKKGYPLTLSTRYHEVVGAREMETTVVGYYQGYSNSLNGGLNRYEISIKNDDGVKSYPIADKVNFALGNDKTTEKGQNALFSELNRFNNATQVLSKLTLKGGKVTGVQIIGVLEKADVNATLKSVVRIEDTTGGFGANTLPGFTAYNFTFELNGESKTQRLLVENKHVPALEKYGTSVELKCDRFSSFDKENTKAYGNFRFDTPEEKNIPLFFL